MSNNGMFIKGYAVFKHVYTEGETGVREYDYVAIFATKKDAQDFVRQYYRTHKDANFYIGGTLDIDVIVFCKGIATHDGRPLPWKWNESLQSYIWSNETGAFKWFKSLDSELALRHLNIAYSDRELEYVDKSYFGSLSVATPFP